MSEDAQDPVKLEVRYIFTQVLILYMS